MFDPEKLMEDGWAAMRQGHPEDARDLFAQAVAESRFQSDRDVRARSLKALGKVERELRHSASALKHYQAAAEIFREIGDQLGWAHTHRHVADIFRDQKRLAEAGAAYHEVVELYRSRTDRNPLDFANALRGFALLKDTLGENEEALLLWQGALLAYEASGTPAGIAEAQSHIAFLRGH